MVNNRSYRQAEGLPPLDEAWWAALLAEEERFGVQHNNAHKGMDENHDSHENQAGFISKSFDVNWDQVQNLFDRDETIALSVTGHNRGGLLVEGQGVFGFVPISHLVSVSCEISEDEREEVLEGYIGRSLYLKVIECEPARGRIVFSERAALATSGRRNQLLDELQQGTCVRGIVTNITDFGIFIDLGGVEGLVHVSEISWGRVRHPGDAVQVGEEVTVYVIHVDKEKARIALSLKRLCDNPWATADQRYHPGQIVDAVVTSVVPFGAFARLEEGLDGLIHITEMQPKDGRDDPAEIAEGDTVQVKILHIDCSRQRLGLGLVTHI